MGQPCVSRKPVCLMFAPHPAHLTVGWPLDSRRRGQWCPFPRPVAQATLSRQGKGKNRRTPSVQGFAFLWFRPLEDFSRLGGSAGGGRFRRLCRHQAAFPLPR